MQIYIIYTLIALFFFGIQTFLYKVSAYKKCNSALTTLSFMITVSILGIVSIIYLKKTIGSVFILVILSLFNALAFLTTTITRMEALKSIPTSIAYPIVRASTIFVIIFSLIYFKETLSYFQIAGVILAILVVIILSENEKKDKIKNFKKGLILALIAMASSAIATILQKFASLSLDKLFYITISYVLNIFFALTIKSRFEKTSKHTKSSKRQAIIIGFFIGLVNFIAFLSVLQAYSLGPLSIVAPLHDLNFVIAIILATIIYKEKVTSRRILGVILSIISGILLSLS